MRIGKAPGPSGLRAEHLKVWLEVAEADPPDVMHWQQVMQIVRHAFLYGEMPAEMCWSILAVIPKGAGEYRGIGLQEVLWKVVSSIINARLQASINFHDSLHGFRSQRGTGTATIEAKLVQQLAIVHQVPLFAVFLDLHKAYDSLDRNRTLDILAAYGVGPNTIRLLQRYWAQQRIVVRSRGYHGEPFTATRGVTQGDIASPTIFNIVVDAVVRYWLSMVSTAAIANHGLGIEVCNKLALFYADDGLVASRDPRWLQPAFEQLMTIFARVGPEANTTITKAMICVPGHIGVHLPTAAYKRRMEGVGDTRDERIRRRVECPQCGIGISTGALRTHLLSQHGQVDSTMDPLGGIQHPMTAYRVSVPTGISVDCPVEGCPGRATNRANLRAHFAFRHPTDVITIVEEGSVPHPRCDLCDMFVPWEALNKGHQTTATCRRGAERKRARLAITYARRAEEVEFTAKGELLESVKVFRYLGRPLSCYDNDWPALHWNLAKARKRWSMISRILTREGASPKTSA